ncbi:MAG: ATP-binding cassette domain-containing protein [Oceanidesulfovibrio sp.]
MDDRVLRVRGLSKIYGRECPVCRTCAGPENGVSHCFACGSVVAMQNVSFDLHAGEILGVMGESGSGKSTLVKCLYFDEQPTSGSALLTLNGVSYDLFALNGAQKRWVRSHRMGMVYQNPQHGLNFRISCGGNIAEKLLINDVLCYGDITARARELLERTEVPVARMDEPPGNFSGGMQQRVQIAKATANNPPLLLLDEVTTGLDVSVQARILDLILELQSMLETTMIVVTHDLGVIRLLSERTIVMKNGCIVEIGLTDQILEDPQHAYTQRLVSSAL